MPRVAQIGDFTLCVVKTLVKKQLKNKRKKEDADCLTMPHRVKNQRLQIISVKGRWWSRIFKKSIFFFCYFESIVL